MHVCFLLRAGYRNLARGKTATCIQDWGDANYGTTMGFATDGVIPRSEAEGTYRFPEPYPGARVRVCTGSVNHTQEES